MFWWSLNPPVCLASAASLTRLPLIGFPLIYRKFTLTDAPCPPPRRLSTLRVCLSLSLPAPTFIPPSTITPAPPPLPLAAARLRSVSIARVYCNRECRKRRMECTRTGTSSTLATCEEFQSPRRFCKAFVGWGVPPLPVAQSGWNYAHIGQIMIYISSTDRS